MTPGTKVICINDKFPGIKTDQLIREGQVYTIAWRGKFTHYVDGTYDGVRLVEIDRGADDEADGFGYADLPFRASRFRPLVEPMAPAKKVEEVV